MNYEQFLIDIQHAVKQKISFVCEVNVNKVIKNNDCHLYALNIIESGKNITPCIYLEEFYEAYSEGEELATIAEQLIDIYNQSKPTVSFPAVFFEELENVKYMIGCRLVNAAKNQAFLQEAPYIPFFDLAICFGCILESQELGHGYMPIYHWHCGIWNVSVDELYNIAMRNMPVLFPKQLQNLREAMNYYIEELPSLQIDSVQEESQLYMLSNEKQYYGAAALLYEGALQEFADTCGQSFYILPSSVHEVMLMPDNAQIEPENLQEMVRDINRDEVANEDYLSDTIYYYDSKTKQIGFVSYSDNGEYRICFKA